MVVESNFSAYRSMFISPIFALTRHVYYCKIPFDNPAMSAFGFFLRRKKEALVLTKVES
jgi:hypothetical protein